MENTLKIKYFEYFVHRTYEWYGKDDNNDLSILKLMKLLFFTTAVNSRKDSDNILLNKVFKNFVAMPFGHVESEIYASIKSKVELSYYDISFSKTKLKKQPHELINSGLNYDYLQNIDDSIQALKHINSEIIYYSAFDLVELSHQWHSWKSFYKKGESIGSKSTEIKSEVIINEPKHFFLNQFDLF